MSTEPTTGTTEPVDQQATTSTEPVTDTKPKLSSEEKKAQILKSFEERVDSGELTLEEVENRQPWVAEAIKAKKEAKPSEEPVDRSKLKSEILEELSMENELDIIQQYYPESLKEYKDALDQYKDSLGINEARKLAKKLTGVDTSSESLKRRTMRLGAIGAGAIETDVFVTQEHQQLAKQFGSDPKKIAQRLKQLEEGGQLSIG